MVVGYDTKVPHMESMSSRVCGLGNQATYSNIYLQSMERVVLQPCPGCKEVAAGLCLPIRIPSNFDTSNKKQKGIEIVLDVRKSTHQEATSKEQIQVDKSGKSLSVCFFWLLADHGFHSKNHGILLA